MSENQEGWGVNARPALIGLAIFVLLLLLLVIGTGMLYKTRYAERARPSMTRFPAPRLETIDTAPGDAAPVPSSPPPGIDHAMAETVGQGDALWGRQ